MEDLEKLKKNVLEYNPKANIALIEKAYNFAKQRHEGQKRESGEGYFSHPLEVANILADMKVSSTTIAGALLHDVVEETNTTIKDIEKTFGKEIAQIVEGVTKIDKVNFETKEDYTAENIRKIILATAKDIRVMLIKLADRLHNMRTLKYVSKEKQRRIANETLNIYAPIAHKLGIWKIKGELEDLALRYLEPEVYKILSRKINEKRKERERKTEEMINIVKKKLKEKNINAVVYGRAKYFYSIYKKMKKKNVDFNEIYDLIAMRIITKTIPECYAALGVVHDLWKPIPRKFKDYIATPKANGYQSLHTVVVGSHGKIIEVQIRTEEMHNVAEDGIAAHWRYKGTERDKYFDKKIGWLKQLLEWKINATNARNFLEDLKIDLFENEIIVFTPKGDPITLPEKSTPVDFAYEVHSSIGNNCSKAMVNKKLVPLDCELKSGDIVEIITSKNAKPSRQWLKFVKTNKARSKIKQALNIKIDADIRAILNEQKEKKRLEDYIIVSTDKKAPIKISKCCNPQLGDKIVAFYTKDKKITVHKKDCPNAKILDKSKEVKVRWAKEKENYATLRLVVEDKVGILAKILNIIAESKINIKSIQTKPRKGTYLVNTIKMDVHDDYVFIQTLKRIKSLKEVISIEGEQ